MRSRFSDARFVISMLAVLAVLVISLVLSLPKQNAQEQVTHKANFGQFAVADAVTNDIRNGAKGFVRVITKTAAERREVAKFGPIVADYGSFVIIAADRGADLSSLRLENQLIETSISLPGIKFDPIIDPPAGTIRPAARETVPGKGYYIVQFGGIATDEWLDGVRDAGVEILQYVPHNAFYVYADGAAIAKAAAHSRVRWVGSFLPEQKITDILRDQIHATKTNSQPQKDVSPLEMTGADRAIFDVAVFERADLDQIAGRITNVYGGLVASVIDLPNNYFNVVRVELPLDNAIKVADIPDVITVDFYGKPQKEDERAAQIVAGNYSSTTVISAPGYNPLTQFGVDGTNVTVSMVDDGVSIPGNGGFWITSANTNDGPLRGSTSGASGGHGHLNASIIAGNTPFGAVDPTGYNYGLGIASKANIINIPFLKAGYTGLEADTYNDTVVTNGVNGIKGSISNNSWGNGTNSNVYDSYTAQFDGFVRDASAAATIDPLMLVFSAGNSGAGLTLTRPKAAKNLIATGNSENLRTELSASSANNMDDLEGTSSRGPAADGRVKPDIVAPGNYITGSGAGTGGTTFGFVAGTSSTVAFSGGTSHAAPQVAGAAALFTQFWKNANGGVNPSPALIKAAILNTGQEMNGVNTSATIPNGNEGWGRINMKLMLNTGVAMKYVNETTSFNDPGNSVTFNGTVADAAKPLRVALVWTDPPGAANANPALVNNLDLTVTLGGSVYKGNVFLLGTSNTGGSADTINNVEMVRLPAGSPVGTNFSITVSATALNGDGILGNADTTDQHFALVAYNFNQQAAALAKTADFDGDGKTDLSVFRPAAGSWYVQRSTAGFIGQGFGALGDALTPGDYDGDGKTDFAVFRSGVWYLLRSTAGFSATSFGVASDLPAQGDYDGDGKTDIAVFRPTTGTWYLQQSTAGFSATSFGTNGDKPVPGDYDGDNKTDIAVYRPSTGTWYLLRSTAGYLPVPFGISTDKVVPADYDGDGKTDIAVFRDAVGTWYRLNSNGGAFFFQQFGSSGDIPTPGDYDGDGKADLSVFRPSNNNWYRLNSNGGAFVANFFGAAGDKAVPASYVPLQ